MDTTRLHTKAVEAVAHPENALFKKMFWSYYRVIMPSGSSYLIKKLNTRNRLFQQASGEQLELDLEMLGKLHHSNVMIPLAYVLYSQAVLLFYEFARTHTLYDVLHNHPSDVVDWTSRYRIAVSIAQGICYLHGSKSNSRDPILVPDLSSKKIMLKSLTEPLVADIELFKVIDPSRRNSSLSAVADTIGYIPPVCLHDEGDNGWECLQLWGDSSGVVNGKASGQRRERVGQVGAEPTRAAQQHS
ncbi:hypothetical protein Bca4012_065558 [Brassica carinata]